MVEGNRRLYFVGFFFSFMISEMNAIPQKNQSMKIVNPYYENKIFHVLLNNNYSNNSGHF